MAFPCVTAYFNPCLGITYADFMVPILSQFSELHTSDRKYRIVRFRILQRKLYKYVLKVKIIFSHIHTHIAVIFARL